MIEKGDVSYSWKYHKTTESGRVKLLSSFTCVSSFVTNIDTINTATGSMLSTKASHGSMVGNAVIMAPMIRRKIVPGVKSEDTNKKIW